MEDSEGSKPDARNRRLLWVVEDDPNLNEIYNDLLTVEYEVKTYRTLKDLRKALELAQKSEVESKPDLIIADLSLPDGSFLRALESNDFRKQIQAFPFIVVSGVDDAKVMKECFGAGGVDFLTKPMRANELLVKIERSLNARQESGAALVLDPITLTVSRNGRTSEALTSKEYQILSMIHQSPKSQATRPDILARVWGASSVVSKTLDVHVFHLRRKIRPLGIFVRHHNPDIFRLELE